MALVEQDLVPTRDLTPLVVPAVTLEGAHVRLEPLTSAHVPGLTALLAPEVFEFLLKVLRTRADVEAYVDTALRAAEAGTERPFVILERKSGTPVGTTRYLDIQRTHRTLEIGHTWLGRHVWRTPLNTECKFLLFRHAFEALGVMRGARAEARGPSFLSPPALRTGDVPDVGCRTLPGSPPWGGRSLHEDSPPWPRKIRAPPVPSPRSLPSPRTPPGSNPRWSPSPTTG